MLRPLAVLLLLASLSRAQINIIYEDDCTSDADCPLNVMPGLFKMADRGEANILALIADVPNVLAAPDMKIMAAFYKRPSLLIGADQDSLPTCSNGCSTSAWNTALVAQYDAGDTRANYADCLTVYRTSLAAQANSSVVIVESGTGYCLALLLASPGDGISPLTGAQLCQQKISKLVVMGGDYPSGTEFNFQSNPSASIGFNYIFTTWTTQNGYPPLWEVSFTDGTGTNAGPPTYAISTVNPARWVQTHSGGSNQRPIWDALAILFGIRGLSFGGTTYFTDSGNGTNTVNASTGANSWSSGTASGQHFLINSASTTVLSQVFDGFSYGFGFAALPPGAGLGVYVQGAVKPNVFFH